MNTWRYFKSKNLEVLCAEIFANGLRIKKNKFHTLRKVESFVAAQKRKTIFTAFRSARFSFVRVKLRCSKLKDFLTKLKTKADTFRGQSFFKN